MIWMSLLILHVLGLAEAKNVIDVSILSLNGEQRKSQ